MAAQVFFWPTFCHEGRFYSCIHVHPVSSREEATMSLKLFGGMLCATCALVFCASATAQKNDFQDKKALENKVAAQKLEREVNEALAEHRQFLKTDPTKAVEMLKKALAKL